MNRIWYSSMLMLCICACDRTSEIPPLFLNGTPAGDRPRVIGSSPSPIATSVPSNVSLYVEFDRDMDLETTRNAFSISGEASPAGDKVFQGSRRIAYFLEDDELATGEAYVMRVASSAQSADLYDLGIEYIVHFTTGSTSDAPQVTATSPTNNAQGVSTTAGIQVFFSRPMDQPTVESAFTISPNVGGDFVWDASGTSFTFQPFADLQVATTYSVTIAVGARDTGGITLDSNHSFSFQVGNDFTKPNVADVREQGAVVALTNGATGVYKDSSFVVTFDEGMEFSSTESAFSLTRLDNASSVSGIFQWNATFTQLTFVPDDALEPSHDYRLQVTTGAEDLAENGLDAAVTIDFAVDNTGGATNSEYITIGSASKTSPGATEALALDSTTLSNITVAFAGGAGGGTARIEVYFSHSIDPNTIADNFSFTKVIGLNAPTTPIVQAVQLMDNGALTDSVLVLDIESLGENDYKLTLFGGRNGIRSTAVAGETGTWLEDDMDFYVRVRE